MRTPYGGPCARAFGPSGDPWGIAPETSLKSYPRVGRACCRQASTARAAACIRSVRRTGMHAIATLIADPTCVAAITPSRALPISGAYGP